MRNNNPAKGKSSHENSKINNNLFIAAGVIIILLSALRYEVGWDYVAYLKSLLFKNTDADFHLTSRGEPLNLFLMQLSQYIESPSIYFILTSIIINSLIIVSIKRFSINPWISLFIFIGFPLFYLNSFSVIRNFVGISIALYSLRHIAEKNIFKFLISIAIASSFHTSGYIALLLYPLYQLRSNIFIFGIITAIIFTAREAMTSLTLKFLPQYQSYTETISVNEGTIAIYPLALVAIIGVLLKDKLPITSRGLKTDGLLNIFLFGVIFYIAFIEFGSTGHRLTLYFTLPLIFLVPLIIDAISKKARGIISFLVYVVCIISFFLTINMGKEAYLPYKTILSNI